MAEGNLDEEKLYFKWKNSDTAAWEVNPDSSIASMRKMLGPSGSFDDWRLKVSLIHSKTEEQKSSSENRQGTIESLLGARSGLWIVHKFYTSESSVF